MYKIIISVFVIALVYGAVSCFKQPNADDQPTSKSIIECFNSNRNHSIDEVLIKIRSEWAITEDSSILFNSDGRYFIFKSKIITELGTYVITYDSGNYILTTSNPEISGPLYICDKYIYLKNPDQVLGWLCKCYI